MPARIRSTVNETPGGIQVGGAVAEASREDLRKGNEVVLESLDSATTYAWTLADTPDAPDGTASTATLLAPQGSNSQTARFVVDNEGTYLVRLVVDQGLPTESVQFVACRYLTKFGNLGLLAAGERRDETGVIPVDADSKGWSNNQNQNLQRLLALVRRTAKSGRVIHVDANRGRDSANDADSPNVTVELPGSDTSGSSDEITVTAEKHGDFSTVGEALTFINAQSPAPSESQPWLVVVAPGLYVEDIAFQPYVFVVGHHHNWDFFDLALGTNTTVLRTANAAGGTHQYASSGPTALMNLTLENTDTTTTTPVFDQKDGVVLLKGCVFRQVAGANVGPAYLAESATANPSLIADSCTFISAKDTSDDDAVVRLNADDMTVSVTNCFFEGARTGIEINRDLYEHANSSLAFDRCEIVTEGNAVSTFADSNFSYSLLQGGTTGLALNVEGFGGGAGAKLGDVVVDLSWCRLNSQIAVDDTVAAGSVEIRTGASQWEDGDTPPAPASSVVGSPTFRGKAAATSISYLSDWQGWDGGDVSPAVPATAQLGQQTDVQGALDALLNLVMPLGISPFWSLGTAYDGLASPDPLTLGDGLGRTILADGGAVQITGANSPLSTASGLDPALDGGLQVEGQLDVGPVVVDGLGTEIVLDPNTWGGGPIVRLGRSVYPAGYGTAKPAQAAAHLVAGPQKGAPTEQNAYNVRVEARDLPDSNQSELGGAVLVGGSRLNTAAGTNVSAGPAVVKGGDHVDGTDGVGTAGSVFLSPGYATNANHGSAVLTRPDSATPMTLDAANPFPGAIPVNSGGSLFLQAGDGTSISVSIPDGTDYATVRTLITTACDGHVVASDNGGTLRLTSGAVGTSAMFQVLGDYVPNGSSGDLLVALGELRLASGATETPGTYPDSIAFRCSASGEITFEGDVVATGSFAASYSFVNTLTHTITSEKIVGVDSATAGGLVTITLPAASVGREILVKDEVGNASVDNIDIVTPGAETIDGAANRLLSSNFDSAFLYSDGSNWFIVF